MQSQPPTYKAPDNNIFFKKWLPFILTVLVILVLLLAALIKNKKTADGSENPDKTVNANVSNGLEDQKDKVMTITAGESSAEDKEKDQNEEADKESAELLAQSDTDKEASEADNEAGNKEGSNQSETGAQSSSTPTDFENDAIFYESPTYVQQPQVNPNDQVLLPRDLPKNEQNVIGYNAEYAETAEQSQDLSDKLSTIVNEVKEQKLQQIEAQQRASREAYLSNQSQSSPTPVKKSSAAATVANQTTVKQTEGVNSTADTETKEN